MYIIHAKVAIGFFNVRFDFAKITAILRRMMLPELSPSRDDFVAAVGAALSHAKGRIYLDASVLIHCYEMNVAASETLLKALETYGDRVGVPAWAAQETWDYTTGRIAKRPLSGLAARVRNELGRFQKESTRYIDDDALKGTTKDDYQAALAEAVETTLALVRKIQEYEPKADLTTARLLPFIEGHRVPSDLTAILDEVTRTAASRMTHRIPPGFADAPPPVSEDGGEEAKLPTKGRGKQKNLHGDLIIWLEILQDCGRSSAEQLVLVTRDTTKGDWVYTPKKLRSDKGALQENNGLVTLPLPLLVHEAQQKCPSLQSVHIVSVETLAHVLRTLKVEVGALAAALQAEAEGSTREAQPDADASGEPAAQGAEPYMADFGSADMLAELDGDDPVDRQIRDLMGEGWKAQNQAARNLGPLLPKTTRTQRIQIGRGLVEAANDGALEPIDFLNRVLADATLGLPVRSDLLIGVLAEIYIDDNGLPKKPVAPAGLIDVVYRFETTANLAPAYEAVISRLEPQSRNYLALPGGHADRIPLTLALEGDQLRAAAAGSTELLEEAAPVSRAILPNGRSAALTTDGLIDLLAAEFVTPKALFQPDQALNATFQVPELTGFILWGPNTGTHLR